MKFLVTGGAGFIGSHLVEALLHRGDSVRVLDNFSTGTRGNLVPFAGDIDLVEGDIRSYHVVQSCVDGIDVVLHQAALPSVPRSILDPITTNDVNVTGTLNLLEAAHRAGVGRVVYASSSSVYGDSQELPKREDMTPAPLSPYAVSKLAAETYCRVFSEIYGLHTVALRYFNVFGRRQDANSQYSAVIPKFIDRVVGDQEIVIYGDGEQSRDFTYVSNIVEANLLAATAPCPSGLTLNCACGEAASLSQLVGMISELTGRDARVRFDEPKPGDVKHSLADVSRARKTIGYEPTVRFHEGLAEVLKSLSEAQRVA